MADWIQYVIVGVAVGLAAAYMVRQAIRRFKSRCGGCASSSCSPEESNKPQSTSVPLTISRRNAH